MFPPLISCSVFTMQNTNGAILLFQMCLNGKCVSEHENAIDYGDGFLRRTGSVEVETFVKKNYQDDSRTQSSTQRLARKRRKLHRSRSRSKLR